MPPVPKSKKQKKTTYTANQLFMAFLVFTGSFLLFAVWPDMKETRHYDNFLASIGVKRSRIETACEGSGDEKQCGFIAKKNIDVGERVVSIPISTIINTPNILQEPTLKSVLSPEGETTLREVFMQHGFSSDYMFAPFAVTFKLWWEKKLGSSSSMAGWIDLMPKQPSHAIFFTDEEATCLDRASFEERNSSLSNARNFANIAQTLCKGRSEYPCTSLDANTVVGEFKWAYATMMQRIWGDVRNPMLIPVVDFAFPHPELCSPNGDKDERCLGRNKQFFLQPKQESEELLVMQAQSMLLKGEKVHSLSQQRAPWETLGIFGYADHAANMIPDLLFLTQFHKFTYEHRIDISIMAIDYPLKQCGERQAMSWSHSGSPKKELRDCWAAMFFFFEQPQHVSWSESAIDAWRSLQDDKAALARYKYMAWLATSTSAENVAQYVASNRGLHCEEKTGKLPVIKETMDISRAIFARVLSHAEKKREDAFLKWHKLDETADRDVPLPQPPAKEVVDETADEIVEDDAATSD